MEFIVFSIISALLLFGFIGLGVSRFGLLPSYSAYGPMWGKAVPMNNTNLWSMVTIAAAFLICPVLIELGVASMWQFLGFLVPVYLIAVALTPDYETDRTQGIIHLTAALLCGFGAFAWLLLVLNAWKVLVGVGAIIFAISVFGGTIRESYVFWLEMFMFVSVYLTIFMILV